MRAFTNQRPKSLRGISKGGAHGLNIIGYSLHPQCGAMIEIGGGSSFLYVLPEKKVVDENDAAHKICRIVKLYIQVLV